MRSLLIATAMCAAALTFTGCSCTVSGPCNSLSHQSRLLGCGCKQGVDCDSCTSCSPRQLIGSWRGQPECCGVNVGDGAPCGLENVSLRRPAKGLLSRLGGNKTNPCGCESGDCSCEQAPATTVIAAPAQSTSDCGCASQTCDGGCGRSRSQLSLGLFGRSSACSQDCDGDCGPNCNNIERSPRRADSLAEPARCGLQEVERKVALLLGCKVREVVVADGSDAVAKESFVLHAKPDLDWGSAQTQVVPAEIAAAATVVAADLSDPMPVRFHAPCQHLVWQGKCHSSFTLTTRLAAHATS